MSFGLSAGNVNEGPKPPEKSENALTKGQLPKIFAANIQKQFNLLGF